VPCEVTFWIETIVLERMLRDAKRHAPYETGGVLLGYHSDARTDVVVTASIGAGPRAIHERSSYEPDYGYQERKMARLYAASGRRATYIGDWHTHPSSALILSPTDRKTLVRISEHQKARVNDPVMLILGGRNDWSMAVWHRCRELVGRLALTHPITDIRVFDND